MEKSSSFPIQNELDHTKNQDGLLTEVRPVQCDTERPSCMSILTGTLYAITVIK